MRNLLERPPEQRLREHKYRCGQAIVFGLPVLALQWLGPQLGGTEAPRWVALFQALLAGWVVYVAAGGILFEGVLRLLERRWQTDLLIGAAAVGMYLVSLVSTVALLVPSIRWRGPLLFYDVVILLLSWTAFRWWQAARSPKSDDPAASKLD